MESTELATKFMKQFAAKKSQAMISGGYTLQTV
jgi:hypothetical protein